jgi:hypothetical protein
LFKEIGSFGLNIGLKMKFKNKQVFNNIISLGVNCENAFVIQDLFGSIDSTLFTWAFVEDPFLILEYIKNPDILFTNGMTLTPSKMLMCNRTKFVFHSKLQKEHHIFDDNKGFSVDKLKEAEEEVYSRAEHLSNKFWNQINSEDRNLFIIKLFSKEEYKNKIGNLLTELTDSLDKKCSNKNFILICVLEENYAHSIEQEIKDNRLVIKRVKKFAHYASTDKFDKEAWKKIYKNICIKDNLKFE